MVLTREVEYVYCGCGICDPPRRRGGGGVGSCMIHEERTNLKTGNPDGYMIGGIALLFISHYLMYLVGAWY